jgi:hypothetical protein
VTVTSRNYELRLEGISSPSGEISLRDLTEIGSALQLTATRIARQVAGAEGPGRSPSHVDRISELRLTGIGEGSTVLKLRLGEDSTLPLLDSDDDIVAQRLEETFFAIATNDPPGWASPPVKQSIGKFVSHLATAGATRMTASWGNDDVVGSQVIAVTELDDSVWHVDNTRQTEMASVTGRLDKVDLRARRFRVRDDVGHDINLEDVVDVDAAALLIGQRVVATGAAEHDDTRLVRIVEPTLLPEEVPASWSTELPLEVLASGPMPSGGIPGIGTAEVEEFLAEIRG